MEEMELLYITSVIHIKYCFKWELSFLKIIKIAQLCPKHQIPDWLQLVGRWNTQIPNVPQEALQNGGWIHPGTADKQPRGTIEPLLSESGPERRTRFSSAPSVEANPPRGGAKANALWRNQIVLTEARKASPNDRKGRRHVEVRGRHSVLLSEVRYGRRCEDTGFLDFELVQWLEI